MITIKNSQEIKNIKKSCQILVEVKKILYDKMKVGISGLELDKIAEKEFLDRGAKPAFKNYQGFKYSICISFNEELIHGIPSDRKLKEGDLVKLDIGCIFNNMYSDSAFTKGIGNINKKDKLLIKVVKKSFEMGLLAIKPGSRIGDISSAIWQEVQKHKMFVPRNFTGHGIGYSLHEEPFVYNKGKKNTGPILKDGMVICIEPMILQKSDQTKTLDDGWTVVSKDGYRTSHYEHTILIENGKGINLTKGI